jgi:ABC-2 type transport system permease protein
MPEPDIWTQRYPIATVLIGVALMLAIFVPLAIRKYGRVSTRA